MAVMGKVVAAHGIRGWVKIQAYTEYLDSLLDYDTWYLGNDGQAWRPVEVLEADVHGKVVVARLQGVEDRTAAEKHKGLLVAVPRAELREEEEGEYYWSDLIGMKVDTVNGIHLGQVDSLLETGANDVLIVKGERERAIPFLQGQTIMDVDLVAGMIVVDWDPEF